MNGGPQMRQQSAHSQIFGYITGRMAGMGTQATLVMGTLSVLVP